MGTPGKSDLLDSDELATALRVPKATLDQWAYRKVGPAFIKVGRHRRYRRAEIERWLDAHTSGGDAA